MKLNPDCVRDTLLYLEECLDLDLNSNNFKSITLNLLTDEMIKKHTQYTEEDIWYTVYNLKEIRFIEGRINDAGCNIMIICNIENITWNGHQFLNNIRPKNIWEATKSGASKLGTMSISALTMIASEITKVIITKPEVIQKIVDNFMP